MAENPKVINNDLLERISKRVDAIGDEQVLEELLGPKDDDVDVVAEYTEEDAEARRYFHNRWVFKQPGDPGLTLDWQPGEATTYMYGRTPAWSKGGEFLLRPIRALTGRRASMEWLSRRRSVRAWMISWCCVDEQGDENKNNRGRLKVLQLLKQLDLSAPPPLVSVVTGGEHPIDPENMENQVVTDADLTRVRNSVDMMSDRSAVREYRRHFNQEVLKTGQKHWIDMTEDERHQRSAEDAEAMRKFHYGIDKFVEGFTRHSGRDVQILVQELLQLPYKPTLLRHDDQHWRLRLIPPHCRAHPAQGNDSKLDATMQAIRAMHARHTQLSDANHCRMKLKLIRLTQILNPEATGIQYRKVQKAATAEKLKPAREPKPKRAAVKAKSATQAAAKPSGHAKLLARIEQLERKLNKLKAQAKTARKGS